MVIESKERDDNDGKKIKEEDKKLGSNRGIMQRSFLEKVRVCSERVSLIFIFIFT